MTEEQQNDKAETINAPLQDDNDYYGGDSSIKVEKEVKEPKETKEETKAKESELNQYFGQFLQLHLHVIIRRIAF